MTEPTPDPRYTAPVAGLAPDALSSALTKSIAEVAMNFPPKTGVCVFVFDYGTAGGLGYIANANRADVIAALREWISNQARNS